MADDLPTDAIKQNHPAVGADKPRRLRLSPFAKGMLAGLLISLAGWALLIWALSGF